MIKHHVEGINKLEKIFEAAPWLKESDKIVHIPIIDPSDPKKKSSLPSMTWIELYEIYLFTYSHILELISTNELARSKVS